MEVEGNIWREAWENAKPVPARRQKRLFDDTKEAEKVLQYLSALKPSEAAHMLIPVLQHASLVRILNETQDEDSIPQLSPVLQVKANFFQLKTIFYKVDVEKLNKPQICRILPYFFQLLGRAEFFKFEVYFIFHINLKKNGV